MSSSNSCGDCCRPAPVMPTPPPPEAPSRLELRLLAAIELISRAALAAFALVMSPENFLLFGGIGLATGIAYAIYKIIRNEPIEPGLARPSCAQGFFDYLSGMRCSGIVSTVITTVFIAGHMHHSSFYVGFCAMPIGIFVGAQIVAVSWSLSHRSVKPIVPSALPTAKPSCCKA